MRRRLRAHLDDALERARAVLCALLGHSRLRDAFMWYHTCLRCSATLGDSLASSYAAEETAVYPHHVYLATHRPEEFTKVRGCTCPDNARQLTWRDTLLVPRFTTWGYATRAPWLPKAGVELPS